MAGVGFQIPGGRYRRAEFFVFIPTGMNRQLVLDGARFSNMRSANSAFLEE